VVVKGKLAAGTSTIVSAVKSVLFPTLAFPTMPASSIRRYKEDWSSLTSVQRKVIGHRKGEEALGPRALLLLTAVAVTFVSVLGVFFYGLIAGIRVAFRFLLPLILLLLVLLLISALLARPKPREG
jgi:SNF family Na+-dependent transporter